MFGKREKNVEKSTLSSTLDDQNVANGFFKSKDRMASNEVELSDKHYKTKAAIVGVLLKIIDGAELSRMDISDARSQITSAIKEIVSADRLALSAAEQSQLINEICDDILGFGPLEELLRMNDIADIMVNGSGKVFIEVAGKVQETSVKFRDEQELYNICQRIVSKVGRRVDEASPICDARLLDGSRVNVIVPPLAIDGTTLTIRKFRKEGLTLEQLVEYGTISKSVGTLLSLISACRCNVIVSGGTGSGKTTLLNCLANYIGASERVITCEDAAELQLQQPHVVRLETRPLNSEGRGEISMRDLVRNSLRMRPDRIVVGEVRGAEVMDLLQAMNTGHSGSMGTIHANSPRECLGRIETLMAIGGYQLPQKTIRELIVGSVDIIIQVSRMSDGTRKVTQVSEVVGMEGDIIVMQDLTRFDVIGQDDDGNIVGNHKGSGLSRPAFYNKAVMVGLNNQLMDCFREMNS